MGEGIAFVKLWPLNPKTGARSSSLRTGFPAPSLDEMASRLSSGGPGMDIEILLGEDGVAALAKAQAVEEAAEVKAAVETKAGEASSAEAGVSTVEEKAVHISEDPVVMSSMEAVAQGPDATSEVTGAGEGLVKARAGSDGSSAPRWLALEVEMFACGSINVPYMMELIKICFEQVSVIYMYNSISISISSNDYLVQMLFTHIQYIQYNIVYTYDSRQPYLIVVT